jgi:hypothetical protein
MPTIKEQLVDDIGQCRSATLNEREIARRMFILDPAFVFKDDKILGFKILNSIAERFRVPIGCVKIAGSSQIGFSSVKNRDFTLGESDLDIAIISPLLFQRYCEIVYHVTNGYRNLTGFKDTASVDQFHDYLRIGYFRPDLMPFSDEKNEWFKFFKTATDRYSAMFKNVNGGIYFSELFFEGKQVPVIRTLK